VYDRARLIVLDQSGYALLRDPAGQPYLDPDRYEVTLVSPPDKPRSDRPGEVARYLAADPRDEAAVVSLAPTLADGAPVHRVLALGEFTQGPAARLREVLGVPGLDVAQTRLLRDKPSMKRHFAGSGVRTPRFLEIDRPLDAAELLRDCGRIVLKPVDGAGSKGFHLVEDERRLAELDRTGLSGRYQAEEFIAGAVHHVDSVVAASVPVTVSVSRYLDPNNVFPTGGQCRSAELDPGPERDELLRANRAVLARLGWFSGVTHLELFLTPSGEAVFCEIAGRVGGGGVLPAFRHRFGIDLRRVALAAQLDLPIPAPAAPPAPADRGRTGWTMIYPPALGPLQPLGQPGQDWLVHLRVMRKPGEVVAAAQSFSQAVAVATVCGPDSDAVVDRLAEVRTALVASR